MNAFLIIFADNTSEWITNFADVQQYMNDLEKRGIVSNVTVQQFKGGLLNKSITYNWNGVSWE